MNKGTVLFIISLLQLHLTLGSSNEFLVYFKDKPNATAELSTPEKLFSQKSYLRKQKLQLAISAEDCKVHQPYLDSLKSMGAKVRTTSKWLNAAYISIEESQRSDLIALSFVKDVSKPLRATGFNAVFRKTTTQQTTETIDPVFDLMDVRTVQSWGFTGKGVDIAVFDAGFSGFENMNPTIQLGEIYNYIFLNKEPTQGTQSHGTNALSLMAADLPTYFTGISPRSTYHLFITEDESAEHIGEEFNWLSAAEKSDSIGIDLISSSLGYSEFDLSSFNHTYSDYALQRTIISFAAHKAYEKGILVVNSIGNENGSPWNYQIFPADDEHVIAVGAVKSDKTIASFSSTGFSNSPVPKPDVVCQGNNVPLLDSEGKIRQASGTSFSCPQIAGLLGLVKEAFPDLTNKQIKETLYASSDRFNQANTTFGNGIPSLKKFFETVDPSYLPEFQTLRISNPVHSGKALLFVPQEMIQEQAEIHVYTQTGVYLKSIELALSDRITSLGLDLIQSGVYLLEIKTAKTKNILKLVSY